MPVVWGKKWEWKPSFYIGFLYLLSATIACVLILTVTTHAAQTTPYKINYQGRLTDAAGVAKPDGQYNMKFRLYSVLSGGSAVWTETRETTNRVTVTNGQFNVQLGDVTALTPSIFTTQPLYFEVELPTPATATCSTASCGSYTEGAMSPRQPLAASAYAMNADTLDGYDAGDLMLASQNNTFTGTNLFKNTSDSTAAVSVKTQGDVSLFNINTTGSVVAIGTDGSGNPALATSSNGRVGIGIGLTAPGATLEVGGDVLFENTTDTSTAFQVKNLAAASLFIVDTLGSQVEIGSPVADGTGVLLVLDTKNTSGDPTGVVGAMYYNSNLAKFRCYEGTAWTDCTGFQNVVTLGADVTNNNATANTIADVTGLSFPVVSGRTYHFSALIHYTAAATTTGSRWAINGPANSGLSYTSMYTLTATTFTTNYANAYNIPAASNLSSLLVNTATIEGIVTPTASGTVIVRFASEVSNSAIVAKAGSTLTWW